MLFSDSKHPFPFFSFKFLFSDMVAIASVLGPVAALNATLFNSMFRTLVNNMRRMYFIKRNALLKVLPDGRNYRLSRRLWQTALSKVYSRLLNLCYRQ